MAKIKIAAVEEIEKSARGSDHDFDTIAQRAELILIPDPAINGEHSGVSVSRGRGKI